MDLKNQLDFIDEEILIRLSKDSRLSYSILAKELNVSNTLIHQRIAKLKSSGLLKNFGIEVDYKTLGFKTGAYMGITLKEAHYSTPVAKALAKIPEIIECDYVSGKYALFIKIIATDNEHLRKVVYEKVHHIKGVGSTDTFISFGSEFKRNPPIRIRE